MSGQAILAIGVLIGLVFPPVSELLRPLLPATIFVFVLGTFLRADLPKLKGSVFEIRKGLALPIVIVFVLSMLVGTILNGIGIDAAIVAGVVLTLASPPSSANAPLSRMLGYTGEAPLATHLGRHKSGTGPKTNKPPANPARFNWSRSDPP